MIEYMIRRRDGDWFDLHRDNLPRVLKPKSCESRPIPGFGHHRIECENVEIAFCYEDPGIQVSFEGDIADAKARQIVEEIRERIEAATSQKGYVISLAGDLPIRF